MEGQYSLFDDAPLRKKRMPSEYAFRRYIGQKVSSFGETHIIVSIDKYYSYFEDLTIGTPHDTLPVDPKERLEAHKTELEYQEYRFSREHDSISQRNIEILKGLIEKMEVKGNGSSD